MSNKQRDILMRVLLVFMICILTIMIVKKLRVDYELGYNSEEVSVLNLLNINPDEKSQIINRVSFDTSFDISLQDDYNFQEKYKNVADKVVTLYMVKKTGYEQLLAYFAKNSTDVITINVPSDVIAIYYCFPEYEGVRATTQPVDKTIQFVGKYSSQSADSSEGIVGGNPMIRVYMQNFETNLLNSGTYNQEIEFVVYNVFDTEEIAEDTLQFGSYHMQLNFRAFENNNGKDI